ncbi:MAG: IS630 family transposase [Microcystis aeruginosa G13-10]|nr:IS630 family transposase [Microcystis aeruginosa G13-10]
MWAKYSLEDRQDPEKRKEFKQKLAEYLKIAKEELNKLQVWFWDGAFKVATQVRHTAPHESGFSLRVIRRKTWGKKSQRKKVSGQRRSGRVNAMGGVRYSDKKRFVEFIKKGNSETFYEVVKVFYTEIIKEWVEAGNKEEDFREKGPKIVLILDNASIHKKTDVVGKLAENMPNLILEYLPAYSPDLNIIELVWHSAKEFIAHRLFKSVEELESLLHQLLNEGGLIIKWDRKLKNKGNSVNAI